ncbi:MAG: SOS response-associated peptidase [Proteobacteria bacterium]|nr:SOS response-associated peptidase [Pseudomonadota bacterium]
MCGRFKRSVTWAEYFEHLGLNAPTPNAPPRYNIAPTDEVYVVRQAATGVGRELVTVRWGLVPYWAKDPKSAAKNINARAETVAEKPSFRDAFARRRCLVLADGFYEWRKEGNLRQPYLITSNTGGPFVFAGLWERWRPRSANDDIGVLDTCTIITTDAAPSLHEIHHRMPVILRPQDRDVWLDTEDSAARLALLRPLPDELLAVTKVSTLVNSVANDDAACIEPELTLL